MICIRVCRNQRGQTLVNALVGLAITAILSVTIASIMAMQSKENRALGEKLASLDLQRTVISTLANSNACNALFAPANVSGASSGNSGNGGGNGGQGSSGGNGSGNLVSGVVSGVTSIVWGVVNAALTFNPTLITPKNPHVFSIQQVPGVGGAPAIVSAGAQVSPTTNTLYLLPSNAATPGIQIVVTSATTAILRLNFDQSKLVHSLRSLEFPLNIQTSGTPTQMTIQGCSNATDPGKWQCISLGGDFFTPGSLTCVRIVDGMNCRLGSNNNGFFGNHIRSTNWRCTAAGAAWPGGGPWACSVASSSGGMIGFPTGQPACVRTSDGLLCTLTSRFDFWSNRSTTPRWRCMAGGGWPP
ncbi:hypothetical protein D3C87_952630 [compost metagenome]